MQFGSTNLQNISQYLNNQMNNIKSQIQVLDQICYECLNSNDRCKKQTQQILICNLTKSIQRQSLNNILDLCSQNTLFVITRYMEKNLEYHKEYQNLYLLFVTKLISWYSENNLFIRNNKIIQYHILNTYTQLLGEIMKKIYKQYDKRMWLIQTINSHPNKFLLYQWKYFIQAVSTIDTQMGFLAYRSLVNNFQCTVLPQSMNIVIIFLKQLTESIKMNELTDLQQKLTIQENMTTQNNKIFKFTKQQQFLARNTLKLLQTILNFPFNITYSQYDMDSTDEGYINFPDELVNKLIDGEFYQSLYFLIQRLMLQNKETEQLIICCMKSLQQIVLCKVSNLEKSKRKKIRQISLKKIVRLLEHLYSAKLLKELIDLNIKIIKNLEMHKFRKYEPYFQTWLKVNFQQINYIFRSYPICFENPEINQGFELLSLIICNTANVKLASYQSIIKEQSNKILIYILQQILIKNQDITKGTEIRSVKQVKKMVNSFFTTIKLLMSLNFELNLKYLSEIQLLLFSDVFQSENYHFRLTNFYFLIIELCNNGFHQKNLYLEKPNQATLSTFGKIINNSISFIQNYQSYKKIDYLALQTGFLLFHERILLECLNGIEIVGGFDQDTYKIISTNKLFNIAQIIPKEESILPFLNSQFKNILSQVWLKDLRRINYSLQIINSSIWKIKWSMRRSILSELGLLNELQNHCFKLIKQNYFANQFIKCRITLMKIITMIGFDDCLDNYTHSIDQTFKILGIKQSNGNTYVNYVNLMYDLRGMASQIDSCQIYPYFLRNIKNVIKQLHKQLYSKGDFITIKRTLKLDRTILENKSQRFMKSKILPQICDIINDSMFYWTRLLNELNKCPLQEMNISLGLQIYRILFQVLNGNYLNMNLILQYEENKFEEFIGNLLVYSIKIMRGVLFVHPKFLNIFCVTMLLFVKQYSDIIFSKSYQLVRYYSEFYQEIVKFCFKFLIQFDKQNKVYQQNIVKLSQILQQIIDYIEKTLKRIHKQQTYSNSIQFKQFNESINLQFVIEFFKCTFKCIKNKIVFENICRSIFKIANLHSEKRHILEQNFSNVFQFESEVLLALYKKKKENEFDYCIFYDKVSQWIKNEKNKYTLQYSE